MQALEREEPRARGPGTSLLETGAEQSLSDLVYGKRVKVNQQDRDRYGRMVGREYTGSLDINAEQIKRGMAWIYRKCNRDRSLLAV